MLTDELGELQCVDIMCPEGSITVLASLLSIHCFTWLWSFAAADFDNKRVQETLGQDFSLVLIFIQQTLSTVS